MRNYKLEKIIVYYARPQVECRVVTARYPLASLRFTVDRINPSSHHICISQLGARMHACTHARTHTHTPHFVHSLNFSSLEAK